MQHDLHQAEIRRQTRQKRKSDYPIADMYRRIRAAVKRFPKAQLYELRDRGFDSVFEQLCACVISIRTLDEVSLPVALRLFEKARTPREILELDESELASLLHGSTFSHQKAGTLRKAAKRAMDEYGGKLPCDFERLTDLPGIGPKCANLILSLACDVEAIAVDIHVHRITNRWGLIRSETPEKSISMLEERIPKKKWIETNELLVPFGKHICTGKLPKCSTCPVYRECKRVGVTEHR
jgi:endonuclease III